MQPLMHRRDALKTLLVVAAAPFGAQQRNVSTLIGNGLPGLSDEQVNNPYGLAIGPDGALYFCDLDNQRIRRFDFATHRTTTIAGDRKSTRLNSSHSQISYAVFCLKKKKNRTIRKKWVSAEESQGL